AWGLGLGSRRIPEAWLRGKRTSKTSAVEARTSVPARARAWQNAVPHPAAAIEPSMATSFLNELLQTLTERGRGLLGRPRGSAAPENLADLGEQLLSGRGEASGVALAGVLLEGYAAASPAQKLMFLRALADRFGADAGKVEKAIAAYHAAPGQATL